MARSTRSAPRRSRPRRGPSVPPKGPTTTAIRSAIGRLEGANSDLCTIANRLETACERLLGGADASGCAEQPDGIAAGEVSDLHERINGIIATSGRLAAQLDRLEQL